MVSADSEYDTIEVPDGTALATSYSASTNTFDTLDPQAIASLEHLAMQPTSTQSTIEHRSHIAPQNSATLLPREHQPPPPIQEPRSATCKRSRPSSSCSDQQLTTIRQQAGEFGSREACFRTLILDILQTPQRKRSEAQRQNREHVTKRGEQCYLWLIMREKVGL